MTGMSSNAFQYTGREHDGTGLYYYRARYYDPKLHRFLSEDPILTPYTPLNLGLCMTNETLWPVSRLTRPQSISGQRFNAYPYVLNNPLLRTDPLGLESKKKSKCTAADIQNCFIDLAGNGEYDSGLCLLNATARNAHYCEKDSAGGGPGCYTAGDYATNLSKCLYKNGIWGQDLGSGMSIDLLRRRGSHTYKWQWQGRHLWDLSLLMA